MNTVLTVLSIGGLLFLLERLRPAVGLSPVRRWYVRALAFNSVQAASAIAGTYLWDRWFAGLSLVELGHWSLAAQAAAGYFAITFIYYWWHRARHQVPFLWRYLHQLHHSPARIEVITSFYKHPLEIIANGMLSSAVLHVLLGLSPAAVGVAVVITGIAEFVYHMNVNTPRWLGFIFQRPEMHRIHHRRGVHHYNYSDLPIWDMLFGTYRNPATTNGPSGFPNHNELRLAALLLGREVKS